MGLSWFWQSRQVEPLASCLPVEPVSLPVEPASLPVEPVSLPVELLSAAAGFSAGLVSPFFAVAVSLSAGGFFGLSLKSVAYQPVPFRRNDEADISFRKLSESHFGQVNNGSSSIF